MDLRAHIQEHLSTILTAAGFRDTGKQNEQLLTLANGNRYALRFDMLQLQDQLAVSVKVWIYYVDIEQFFRQQVSYTLQHDLASRTFSGDIQQDEVLATLDVFLEQALLFFEEFAEPEDLEENLRQEDVRAWVTADKVTRFKSRFAEALQNHARSELLTTVADARKYAEHPASDGDRDQIVQLCEDVLMVISEVGAPH